MNLLSREYIIQKFFEYCGKPTFNKCSNTYQGSCPICREGKSWLKKRRCFYIVSDGVIYCHNCNKSWNPIQWIMEVSGLTYKEVLEQSKASYKDINSIIEEEFENNFQKDIKLPSLPTNSINLFDPVQIEYWKNKNFIVKEALKYIESRKIITAINKPSTLWLSLTDYVHKNRIVFPFYSLQGMKDIDFYQSRGFLEKDLKERPKYISKIGGDKTIFNADKINLNDEYIFLFEGMIDSCFVKNGVAVGGINLSSKQRNILDTNFKFYKKIWVLDNQHIDEASYEKTKQLIEQKETVFIWKKEWKNWKDFNDMCISQNINEISKEFIIENCFSGLQAKLNLCSRI